MYESLFEAESNLPRGRQLYTYNGAEKNEKEHFGWNGKPLQDCKARVFHTDFQKFICAFGAKGITQTLLQVRLKKDYSLRTTARAL